MSGAELTIGHTAVIVAPPEPEPCAVDAVVEEQDTALVLDIDPVIRETEENYTALVDDMVEQQPLIPGDVVVRGGRPLRFLAIIHDLDKEPTCEPGAIAVALENLARQLNRRRVRSLAMPLLGTVFGRFEDETFLTLLYNSLQNEPLQHTERLWLIAPPQDCDRIARHIHKQVQSASFDNAG